MKDRPRVGLALGSGSARGWAHIGVLRALAERGIEPDIVCGTSVGAFIGAAYASGELDRLEKWAGALGWREVIKFFDIGLQGGLIHGRKLVSFFSERFQDEEIGALDKPFACVATDLLTGREVWLREGSVLQAVRASIAIPGLIAPAVWDGAYLVDGALVNPVPVSLCRALGAEVVIGVEIGTGGVGRHVRDDLTQAVEAARNPWWRGLWEQPAGNREEHASPMPSLPNVLVTSIAIMQERIARSRLAGEPADVLLRPRLPDVGLLEFHRANECFAEGRAAVSRASEQLDHLLVS